MSIPFEDAGTAPALRIRDLRVTFARGDVEIVHGVDLDVAPGRTLVLLGESGSGKSVTSRAILGLHGRRARVEGSILVAGREVTTMRRDELRTLRGGGVGFVPQDPNATLDPLRNIGSQVVEVLASHDVGASTRERRARCEELLSLVDISDPSRIMRSRPHELSGGLKQRVAIAMAVACGPALLIADEPTTALDASVQKSVLVLFKQLQETLSTAILLVTHDIGVARYMGGTIAVMYRGRLKEVGAVEQVLTEPRHPYTAALLAAVPTPLVPRGQLPVIQGQDFDLVVGGTTS